PSLFQVVWPHRFHTPDFWQWKETGLNAARFGMALELAFRIFRAFPSAFAVLRRLVIIIVIVTAAAVIVTVQNSPAHDMYNTFVGKIDPVLLNGTVWLFVAMAVLIMWYRLPVLLFYKAILLSYLLYLLIFTIALKKLGTLGGERGVAFQYLHQLAYLVLVAYWNY